jgi:hypothetical protein
VRKKELLKARLAARLPHFGAVQFDKEASQTHDYCVAKSATLHAAHPDPSEGKKRPPQDDNITDTSTGAMIKKKAKKTAARKIAKKKVNATTKKEAEAHPAEVRKEVSLMVEEQAATMAQAVINKGKTGQLATVKYLFEVAGVFPPTNESKEGTPEEDSLAKTLLTRLNIPLEPIKHDEDEDEEPLELGQPVKTEGDDSDESGKTDAKSDGEAKSDGSPESAG